MTSQCEKRDENPPMKTANSGDFSVGSVKTNILRLAVPMTLAELIQVMYNIVDRIFIGHIPGTSSQALTGVGVTLPLITILIAFANLFGTGGAPLFSIARGAGDKDRARDLMGNTFALLLIAGGVMMGLIFAFKRPLLYLFGASENTYPYADAYLTVYLLGTFFSMVSLGMNGFINAQGFGMIGMLTVSIGAALNLILDPLLIFVLQMGVRGAAVATVISQAVSAIWVLRFLRSGKVMIPLEWKSMKLQGKLVRQITSLGISGFVMGATSSLVQIVCNKTLQIWGGSLGDLYVGVMTVINSVREIVLLPMQGLSSGAQPVMSFNYGAKQYGRVKEAIRFTTVICVIFSCAVWALLLLFPQMFMRLFNDEPMLIAKGVSAMRIYFFGIFLMALQMAGQSTFVALGYSKYAIFFSLLRKAIIVVPLTVILPYLFGLGTDGVFWAEPISNLLGGIACFVTMLCVVRGRLTRAQQTETTP